MSRSRRGPPNKSIELSSHNAPDLGPNNPTTNTFWRGDDESIKIDDGDSERAVLGPKRSDEKKGPVVVKTVSVTVEENRERGVRGSASRSEEGSMKGYEHI
jgi:hypothetical protein